MLRKAFYLTIVICVILQLNACSANGPAERAKPVAETWSEAQTQPAVRKQPAPPTRLASKPATPPTETPAPQPASDIKPVSKPVVATPTTPLVSEETPPASKPQVAITASKVPVSPAVPEKRPVSKTIPKAESAKPTPEKSLTGKPTSTAQTEKPSLEQCPTSKPAIAATTAPASQPAHEIVLVRLGDRATVTQADFEAALYGSPEGQYKKRMKSTMILLTHRRLFDVYVEDHNLISDEELDAKIESDLKNYKVESLEDLNKKLQQIGLTLEDHRRATRSAMAEAALSQQGIERGKDEAYLKELFDTRREEFDGTYVEARHIMLSVAPYELPAEKEAKRKRLLQMKKDIASGKRTWEECVSESDSAYRQGSLGGFTRHFMKNEFLTEAAFALKVGELSDLVETPLGYHLIEVTKRVPGKHDFEQAKRDIRRWLQQESYIKAIAEVTRQYPVIGVQQPQEPTHLSPPPKPKLRMPRLKAPRKPATKPAATKKEK